MDLPVSGLTICICTFERPDVLARCLRSIVAGTRQPDEVIVSDDSRDGAPTAAVCHDFPSVRYVRGPQRGLCANRNAVIAAAKTSHISLLDDDAVVTETFVERACLARARAGDRELITGAVIEDGRTIVAANPSFLGYFTAAVGGRRENINLNCNVLPRAAFAFAAFDERIRYGYEDMDLCARLVSVGFVVRYDSELVNMHLPPPKDAAGHRQRYALTNRARFYTTVKRYLLWQRAPLKLAVFSVYAPLHRAASDVKAGRWSDLPACLIDMVGALVTVARHRHALENSAIAPWSPSTAWPQTSLR